MLLFRDFLPGLRAGSLPARREGGAVQTEGRTRDVNEYEILLMLDPDLLDTRQEEILTRIRTLVEQGGGTWVRHDAWGRRRLAYEIDKKTDGVYHLLELDSTPETLEELSRILKITDGVMRHLAVHRVQSTHGPSRPGPDSQERPAPAPEYAATNVRSGEEE
jgi:small subunit ribosomal protein S6